MGRGTGETRLGKAMLEPGETERHAVGGWVRRQGGLLLGLPQRGADEANRDPEGKRRSQQRRTPGEGSDNSQPFIEG